MNLIKIKNRRGFTLVELLIVIVILGIIAALILPRLVSQPEKARIAEAGNTLGILGRTLSATSQMRGGGNGSWLDIENAGNRNQLGLSGTTSDTPFWNFESGSTVDLVTATRINTQCPTSAGCVCDGSDKITLHVNNGVFEGAGCYARNQAYDATTILKGQ